MITVIGGLEPTLGSGRTGHKRGTVVWKKASLVPFLSLYRSDRKHHPKVKFDSPNRYKGTLYFRSDWVNIMALHASWSDPRAAWVGIYLKFGIYGLGRVGSGTVDSGQEVFKLTRIGSGPPYSRPDPTRPARFDLIREHPCLTGPLASRFGVMEVYSISTRSHAWR